MRRKVIDKRYKILKKLGSGAMGDVYKVRDLKDNRVIAQKILSKKKTSSDAVQRFKKEFRLLAELHHPNLCEVYNFGTLKDGRSYFTMEYIAGSNIFKFTKNSVRKNISNRVYPLIVQLCRALEYIHSKGLMHYDIKPGNIFVQMFDGKPVVKLMDFGLVGEQRIKGGILIRGTLPYIAPEVIRGLAVDHRADLYSLGMLLYEIFTRKRLRIDVKSSFATLLQQSINCITEKPSKYVVDIPRGLERLIVKLTDTEPGGRFSRANEVIKEINKIGQTKFTFETKKTIEGYLLSSRFVGRNKEMELLKSLYEQAQQGEGKVVLITGDAGIGKSRLLKEFKIFIQMKRGHCFAGFAYKDKVGPLEPFYEVFKELINYIKLRPKLSNELKLSFAVLFKIFPDLAIRQLKKSLPELVPLEPKQEKLRTFDAFSELIKYIASSLGELVILLEDLHWADNLSIEFLEYLGRNLENRNIFICGTSRKEELKENLVFNRTITNLRDEDYYTQFELRPLKFKNLHSFLDSTITPESNSSELVRYLMKKTGGNPFFVEEIMRMWLRTRGVSIGERVEMKDFKRISFPGTIEDVVLKKIKDLDSSSQRVVKFGAVLITDFTYDLIKRLTGLNDSELSRALWKLKRRQVLVEEDKKYRFYHATMREAVHKRLGDKERRDLNYQIGKTLERINRQRLSKVFEDLAYYFINAKDRKKGIKYGLQAAKKSSERYANEQVIRFYKGVLGLLDNKDLRRRFDVLQKLAQIEILVGFYDEAIRHYNKALSLKAGTIDKKIGIYIGLGQVYGGRGKHNKTLRIFRKGLRVLEKMKSARLISLLKANIKVRICREFLIKGDYKSASKFNFDALRFLRGLKGKEAMRLQGSMYHNMAIIETQKGRYSKTDYDKAISYYKKSYKYFKKIDDEREIATVLNDIGTTYLFGADLRMATKYYQKTIQKSKKIGYQNFVSTGLCNLGNILKNQGYYLKALDYFQKALFISKKTENPFTVSASLLGLGGCFYSLCNYKKAKEYLEKGLETVNAVGWNYGKTHMIWAIGDVYHAEGDYTSAIRFYRKALRISRDIGNQGFITYSFEFIGLSFLEIGEFLKAKKYIKNALKIANGIESKYAEIGCYIHLCHMYTLLKDYITAMGFYKKGIRIVKKIGMRRYLLQLSLCGSEIYYQERKYLKGIKLANKTINLAKAMGTNDLYAEALLMKVKNEYKQDTFSKIEVMNILNEAKKIAEEIGCPEILWKIYFEYGKFFQDDKQYLKALDYYDKCNDIFGDISSKIKNESYKQSYLNRPDRQLVDTAINEIERLH